MDAPVYARPAISLISEGLGPFDSKLYIGGLEGARDLSLLRAHGIGIRRQLRGQSRRQLRAPSRQPGRGRSLRHRLFRHPLLQARHDRRRRQPGHDDAGAYYILHGALHQRCRGARPIPIPTAATSPSIAAAGAAARSRSSRSISTASSGPLPDAGRRRRPYPRQVASSARRMVRERPKPMLYDAARKASDWIDLIEGAKA